MKYAEIGLNLPIDKTFHYRVPDAIAADVEIGKRVWVPFGKRRMVGYVIGISGNKPVFSARDIEEVIDENPIIPEDLMKLAKWISDYYCAPWGSALAAAIPAPLKSALGQYWQFVQNCSSAF